MQSEQRQSSSIRRGVSWADECVSENGELPDYAWLPTLEERAQEELQARVRQQKPQER
jgi:hypothetical protein